MSEAGPNEWLRATGDMAQRIRAFDWATTPLGPMAQWPDALRFALNLLLPSQAQMVLFWGEDLRAFYNDTYAPTIGTKHPHALGRPAREGWVELWDDLGPLLRKVMDSGETLAASDRPFHIDRAGFLEEVFFDISFSAVRGPQGDIAGVLCIVSETTGRVRAARQLAERESQLRLASERIELALNAGTVLGTWVWDVLRDNITADERFARTFGLSAEALHKGLPLGLVTQSIHAEDIARVNAQIAEALKRGGPFRSEYRVLDAQGQWRWIEANGRAELGADGQVVRFPGVLVDIHAQKTVQASLASLNATLEQRVQERTRDLIETQETLRQAQKMEAVGQLTGGIAHDFNNLLGTISNSLQILRGKLAQGRLEGVERYIGMGEDSVRRAAALTHRLLAFSRRQTLDPKPLDANQLVRGMEELVRRTVGPEIAVEVVGAAGLWATRADASQLENSLLNLCINARDAMPQGGRLTIETANKWMDHRSGAERDLPPGQYVALCVTDTGSGMSPETVQRIFDPFFTTKPLGMGTGLGLSMVYGFVRQSGGHVRVYSEIGQGTTMCLYLPRHTGALEADAPLQPPQDIAQGDGETVVVIEDEWGIRVTIEEVLQDAGYRVHSAETGPAGLALLDALPRVDLLITDVGLPGGMNGRQVADAARSKRPELKVLFITGYADNAAVGNGHLEPGMAVLTKPFEIAALSNRVRAMVDTP